MSIRQLSALVFFLISVSLAACGGGSGPEPAVPSAGTLSVDIDLVALQAGGAQLLAVSDPVIDQVTVNVSRSGFATITQDLTIVDNVASGQIMDLEAGYWNVEALVYSAGSLVYQGLADVNIVAGADTSCQILFDPVVVVPTTGSLSLTVGLNPLPGYRAVDQTVTDILFDDVHRRIYIFDASVPLVGVYDADTLNRIKDITLPQAPGSIALATDTETLYLGYSSGQVYELNTATEAMVLLGEVLADVQQLAVYDANYLVALAPNGSYKSLKVIDRVTGQEVSSMNSYYNMTSLLPSPGNNMIYAHHIGVSPTDIHYFSIDPATGELLANGDSIYHGTYSMGAPLRLLKNATRLATASGNMFTTSSLVAEDLLYAGNLGYSYIDLAADDADAYVYVLNSSGIQKLLILNPDTLFLELAVDLLGTPERVLFTADDIIVYTTQDGFWYVRSFSKTDLGLK